MIVNIATASFFNINSYIILIIICVALFILDTLLISIIKKVKIIEFITFLTKTNN